MPLDCRNEFDQLVQIFIEELELNIEGIVARQYSILDHVRSRHPQISFHESLRTGRESYGCY